MWKISAQFLPIGLKNSIYKRQNMYQTEKAFRAILPKAFSILWSHQGMILGLKPNTVKTFRQYLLIFHLFLHPNPTFSAKGTNF
ncbi:hypothetical protein SAMN05660909_04902 [Chitinophaga terrae (ex Kim and Jung 2007)]|uniref:Uncharacterized protein n=1 Tax=Chitinophaga terrae (ex Kim and Jung 2007) TaxID=408074 RepID=A0A1H4G345_9BACT|nr:hypothetical protein SAMN05660909_04902 [Chitinophaga terrae (ex Kim and Jung 2007)]